ncbi:MAG: glutamyl-tRNA reductase [Dehalococcoidales bacterium]
MNIYLVGINHRTAPVAVLERAAIRSGELNGALQLLRSYVPHGIILSTCNRTEVYTVTADGSDAREAVLRFLQTHLQAPDATLLKHTYVLDGELAVEHLFRTASGLDSMVVGEYEVLGQVRQALEISEKADMTNPLLRRIFQSAVRTGRRVRKETGISKNALSVGSVAVALATTVIGSLRGCRMLIIGTGEAGRLVAKAAKDRGVSQIAVASRTQERAASVTGLLGGTPVSMNNLAGELHTCSIIVTCADAPHYVLGVPQVEAAMQTRPGLPLVIIDIAVPRNVEPMVAQISNVSLYNIDGLSRISEQNRRQRQSEVKKAEKIISAEMAKFVLWWQANRVSPLIRALMSKAEEIRRSHLDRTVKKLPSLTEEERYSLEMMTKAIVAKILKDPIRNLKVNGHSDPDYMEMVKELFQLDTDR